MKASDEAGFTALHIAAEFGGTEQVALLLKSGADPEAKTKDGDAALQAVCGIGGTEEVVAALLKANSKVNARDHSGRTAVGKAAFFGKHRIVARLLEAGADPNHVDGGECSVLFCTAGGPSQDKLAAPDEGLSGIKQADLGSKLDYLECAKLLIKQGAKVNGSTDGENRLPLCYASSTGFEEMVDLLLENGAKVNAKTGNGITPLLNAVNFDDAECVRVLRKYGADPDIAAADGMTPRALAICQQLGEITKRRETAK